MADSTRRGIVIDAIAGEKRSYALYRAAAERCASESVASLLRRLATDELRHMTLLVEHFETQFPGISREVTLAVPSVDAGAADRIAALDLVGVLRQARDEEAASVRSFELRIAQAEGVELRAILRKLLDDERRHLKSIEHELERVRAGKVSETDDLDYGMRRLH